MLHFLEHAFVIAAVDQTCSSLACSVLGISDCYLLVAPEVLMKQFK